MRDEDVEVSIEDVDVGVRRYADGESYVTLRAGDGWYGEEPEFLTLDGARAVAAALIEAADRLSGPTGATLTPSDAPTGTGGSDNESEAL